MSLINTISQTFAKLSDKNFLIGLSGGVDSVVLLHLLSTYYAGDSIKKLRAIHIHHGLSPNADSWANFCQSLCDQYGIPLIIKKVLVHKKAGIEAGAREARYQAVGAEIGLNEYFVTAHHQDDQAETFFLALKRGSGVKGLAAMQPMSFSHTFPIFRPLLSCAKSELILYAQQHQLIWIEDESNKNIVFDRNFLRQTILPRLNARWPHFSRMVIRTAQHCADQQKLLDELLAQEFNQLYHVDNHCFDISHFSQYSSLKQHALLRLWFQQEGVMMPSSVQLSHLITNVVLAHQDRIPQLHLDKWVVRRYQQNLYLTPNFSPITAFHQQLYVGVKVDLPDNLGCLQLVKISHHLTACWQSPTQTYHTELPFPAKTENIYLTFGYAGKVCLATNHFHQDIKKVWQKLGVPPWLRQRIPLIFYNDQLQCAVGFFQTSLPKKSVLKNNAK